MTLLSQLIRRITEQGPLPVADYMEACNTHYYATRDPFGAGGDFITAPEISQVFGELLGAWMLDAWMQAGSPKAILCELGPGRGTLMRDALNATKRYEAFHSSLHLHMVETSPVLQAAQQRALSAFTLKMQWQAGFLPLPPLPLFLIANEFFDALPIHQFYADGTERHITERGGMLHWDRDEIPARETSPASLEIMQSLAQHLRAYGGAALIIDYGYRGGSRGCTLQAVKHHTYADPLLTPGEADLTAHVDMDALAAVAEKAGLGWNIIGQGPFLRQLGIELRTVALCKQASEEQKENLLSGMERLTSSAQMGELFKVLIITSLS